MTLLLLLSLLVPNAHADDASVAFQKADPRTFATGACQGSESWNLGAMEKSLPPEFVDSIHLFLKKKLTTVRGFSEALAMRRQAKTPEEKFFAEYWISRALYGSKMVHSAAEGFGLLASRPPSPDTAGIQLAALECMVQIHNLYPAIAIPENVIARIPEYFEASKGYNRNGVIWDLATHHILDELAQKKYSASEAESFYKLVKGSTHHESLVRGLFAAQRSDHSTAIRQLRAFLTTPNLPYTLRRYVDTAHLLLGRALYSVEQYDQAATQFKMVSKSSNELADALSELTWAYLMNEQYKAAVGTAMNLQAGGLRHTFAPEAPMVMSMAMNEICQYPESVKAANVFRKNYEAPFKWLDQWKKNEAQDNLYKLAVQYLKKTGDTPLKVASEWVRSPVFIANQDEINLLFEERGSAQNLTRWGSREQASLGQSILDQIRAIKPAFKRAKRKQKPGELLPSQLRQDLAKLRLDLASFRHLQKAAPVWKAVLANHLKRVPGVERRLIAEINSDLRKRSDRMRDQLIEIAENIELIEVEIYNGASQDIIWQNAHPEYRQMAKELSQDNDRAPASQVWNWGHSNANAEDGGEIWEDELGSFKADLVDNCTSKDRYLALKYHRGGS